MDIIYATPKDKKWIKEIYKFQLKLYKKDPYFIPNLKMDTIGGLGEYGILDYRNPFHKKANVIYMIAQKNNKTVGTIAAIVNHAYNDFHKEKMGFFGAFEVVNDYEVAKTLLDEATEWLKREGMTHVRGPFTLDINGISGVLVEGFDTKPFVFTAYNFPYYKDLLEKYGFEKEKDLLAELMPIKLPEKEEIRRQARIKKVVQYIEGHYSNIRVEALNLRSPERHFRDMNFILNEAWKDNWGYVPLAKEEFDKLAEGLKLLADPRLFLIAYINDQPAGFIGVLPDIYEVTGKYKFLPEVIRLAFTVVKAKLKRFKRARLFLFGLLPEYRKMGLDALLFSKSFEVGHFSKYYQECELSWLLEDNGLVIRAGKKLDADIYKVWRIFGKTL